MPEGSGSKRAVQQFIRSNRRNPILRRIASGADKYLRAFYNENFWDADKNGEGRVLEILGAEIAGTSPVLLDVGANLGDWARLALISAPDANVHCFELVPGTFQILSENLSDCKAVTLHNFGLSDQSQTVEVAVAWAGATGSSIDKTNAGEIFQDAEKNQLVPCLTKTGDLVVEQLGLAKIDFLKIDVEGHESRVLRGFESTFSDQKMRPRLIQFEYGGTFIPAGATLYEVCLFLGAHGYRIGRVYPDHVDFKSYEEGDEHFRMGNYIAVQRDDPLESKLS